MLSLTFGTNAGKGYLTSIRAFLAFILTAFAVVPAAAVIRNGTGTGPIPPSPAGTTCGAPLNVLFAVSNQSTPIGSMSASFTGTHTYVGDLQITLIAPNTTTSHLLFSGVGRTATATFGDSSNLSGTYLFGDAGTLNIWQQAAGGDDAFIIPAGSYRTQTAGPFTTVNPGPPLTFMTPVFSGLSTANANGNWTLRFLDCGVGDAGSITAAQLSLFGPSAAGASITGRVATADGRGVPSASISVIGGNLESPRAVITNPFGYFRIDDLPAGQTYVLTASSKRYFISNSVETITLFDDFADLNFVAEPY